MVVLVGRFILYWWIYGAASGHLRHLSHANIFMSCALLLCPRILHYFTLYFRFFRGVPIWRCRQPIIIDILLSSGCFILYMGFPIFCMNHRKHCTYCFSQKCRSLNVRLACRTRCEEQYAWGLYLLSHQPCYDRSPCRDKSSFFFASASIPRERRP